ncbi:MAG: hypothetical protein WBV96_14740 [Polyangia bacterium]
MAKILGSTTTYHGDEHPYLRGLKVRIVAVMKRAAAPDHDPDRDGSYLRDEDAIARAGGVTAEDRVEVQPWLEGEQRWNFVCSDPRALDLGCFKKLAEAASAK